MANIPLEKVRSMVVEIDCMIRLADSYSDFVLGALLCTAREHLELAEDKKSPPIA